MLKSNPELASEEIEGQNREAMGVGGSWMILGTVYVTSADIGGYDGMIFVWLLCVTINFGS